MKDIKTKKKMLSCMATVTKKTASFFGNVSCTWWDYQPKTPDYEIMMKHNWNVPERTLKKYIKTAG